MEETNFPQNEEELFRAFISARVSVIWENSYEITSDCTALFLWAWAWATKRNFVVPSKEDCGIYFVDQDDD